MMYEDIKDQIYLHFLKYNNLKRYNHSLMVMDKALSIVKDNNFQIDVEKVKLAAMLHDVGKVLPKEEQYRIILERKKDFDLSNDLYAELLECENIWHSFAGGVIARDLFGVRDQEIINAIYYHTSGKPAMSLLESIIYISDVVEDSRTYPSAGYYRKLVKDDFEYGLFKILEEINRMLIENEEQVFSLTKDAFLYYKEKYARKIK